MILPSADSDKYLKKIAESPEIERHNLGKWIEKRGFVPRDE